MADFDLQQYQQPGEIQRVLRNARTIAIVGLSANPLRASHFVGVYLQRHGYRIIPVNPAEAAVLGERSHASLREVGEPIDVVAVFRAASALPGIAADAVAVGARSLWCQFGVVNEAGAQLARAGGLTVVMDRCIKVEHARYAGRMHWLGLNTHRVTSRRGGLQ